VGRFEHEAAPDVARDVVDLVDLLGFEHIDSARVHCRRSRGSTADAYARIWELPGMWQTVLEVRPQYVIEVLAEHFDDLDREAQLKILIHELLHIPRTFSGAVRNHRGSGERIDGHAVNRHFRRYRKAVQARRDSGTDEDSDQLALPL
jgi:predicted metallopeptidase